MRKTRSRLKIAYAAGGAALVGLLIFHFKPARTPLVPPLQRAPIYCRQAYLGLYAKDSLDFRMVFGYKDARPARLVGDRYERNAVISRVLAMGFVRDPADDDRFRTELLGPDGKKKTIELRLLASSAGPDDAVNRRDPFQTWKSKEAEHAFYEGLGKADLVFYNGHSRTGGGPDFAPPRLSADQHVDYGWYQKNRPGFQKMVAALHGARPGGRLLGLFSCVSDRHFSRGILEANAGTALLATETLLYFSDSLDASVEALEDVLKMKCRQDFHPAGTHLMNFFGRS
jgi:hypothetical protein